jgi:hypothetical protein
VLARPRAVGLLIPPASASADVVLDTCLRALVAGDCADGRKLTTATVVKGNGELCGDARVSDYKINPEPGGGGTEEVYATILTTGGSSDGSIQAGSMTWFYQLVQQADGSWRIAGGGSGP